MLGKGEESSVDIEAGPHRPTAAGESDGTDDDQSWHSPCRHPPCGESSDEIEEPCRDSCISDFSSELDLECGDAEIAKAEAEKDENDCRICHLSLEIRDSGVPIVLGCSCKNDLAAAHKQCAETWFKIKGNKTCEICGSMAKNVGTTSEHPNETNSTSQGETRSFWQGHCFLNFLLACMLFAFVMSWLFRFNTSS